MFIITLAGKEKDGAFSVTDEDGEKILYLFEEEDDAFRFAMMLEEDDYPETHVMEVEDNIMIEICDLHNHSYAIITSNDIVVPPKDNDFI